MEEISSCLEQLLPSNRPKQKIPSDTSSDTPDRDQRGSKRCLLYVWLVRRGKQEQNRTGITTVCLLLPTSQNVPFERYHFNKWAQEASESYDQYKMALRKLAEGCEFHTITPMEILYDCLIFDIRDVKVQERFLRESQLTLKTTDEICRALESTAAQLKEVSEGDTVSAVNFHKKPWRPRGKKGDTGESTKECGNFGRIHKANNCFARGKLCGNCDRLNHFAAVCQSGKHWDTESSTSVKAIDQETNHGNDSDKIYVISEIAVVTLDDTQLVTLGFESGNYLHF